MRSRRAIFLIAMGIVLSFPQAVSAQWVHAEGPGGCEINALAAVGPNIFAGTEEGVFLSMNNGKSWTAVNSGLPEYTQVNCLVVSGENLFAGTDNGVWRLPLSNLSIKK